MSESSEPAPPATSAASHDASLDKVLNAMSASRSGPEAAKKKEYTYADLQKVLDETPLFMRETPKESGDNYVLEALKSLVFEGEGDEVSLNFKNHGNELYAQKTYRDAIDAYTQGLDAGPTDPALRVTLLNNRAASNLALKNYRSVLRDTSAVIALAAAKEDEAERDPPPKTLYRAAQALTALEKWDEAADAIARGKKLKGEEDNKVWTTLGAQVEKGKRTVEERKERERRKAESALALKQAVAAHGLFVVNTNAPPDNPNPLHFDPASVPSEVALYPPEVAKDWTPPPLHTPIIFPVFLLYPQHNTSDLITHFHEDTSFEDQLAVIFPASPNSSSPPWSDWDQKHEYYTSNLVVYVETAQRRLLKVGKEITLREVITKARRDPADGVARDGIVLRDGLMSFVVLVKGKEEREWIDNFKKVRDGGK